MVYVSYRGVEIGEKLQNVLLGVQYLALALFVIFAFASVFGATPPAESIAAERRLVQPVRLRVVRRLHPGDPAGALHLLGLGHLPRPQRGDQGPEAHPGRAALLSTVILMVTYVLVAVAAISYAGLDALADQDDVFLVVKDALFGPWAWLLVLAVLISAVSSTQTTILPTARGTLSMAVYKALPARFGRVHPRFKTPGFSTLVMGVVAIAFYVGMTLISENFLADSIYSLGLAIAFYYGITGYACVWYFRKEWFADAQSFVFKFLFPLLGALLLTAAFIKSAIDMFDRRLRRDRAVRHRRRLRDRRRIAAARRGADVRLGGVPGVADVLPRRESLNRDTEVLVPEDEHEPIRSIDGGRA